MQLISASRIMAKLPTWKQTSRDKTHMKTLAALNLFIVVVTYAPVAVAAPAVSMQVVREAARNDQENQQVPATGKARLEAGGTNTDNQVPTISHNCKKHIHSLRCINRCSRNLTNNETAGLAHACRNEVHSPKCVNKCVINTTEIKPSVWPPSPYVRFGNPSPKRDRQAESAMLKQVYSQHSKPLVLRNQP